MVRFRKQACEQVIPITPAPYQKAAFELGTCEFNGARHGTLVTLEQVSGGLRKRPTAVHFLQALCNPSLSRTPSLFDALNVLGLQWQLGFFGKPAIRVIKLLICDRIEWRHRWRIRLVLTLLRLFEVAQKHCARITDQIVPQWSQRPVLRCNLIQQPADRRAIHVRLALPVGSGDLAR